MARVVWYVTTAMVICMAFLALLWSIWLVRVYRRDGRRERLGLCLRCGYDLRQAPGRCPECGEPAQAPRPDKFHHG